MISLYFSALSAAEDIAGQAFNIGGSIENSLSLLGLFMLLENILDVKLRYEKLPPRESDQKVFVADISKINNAINWFPQVGAEEGIMHMLEWLQV